MPPPTLDSGGYQILRDRAKDQHARADHTIPALARIYDAARLGKDEHAISLGIPSVLNTPHDEAFAFLTLRPDQRRCIDMDNAVMARSNAVLSLHYIS
nr:hypothetical protein [Candidatus Sigynarchaeum springense]